MPSPSYRCPPTGAALTRYTYDRESDARYAAAIAFARLPAARRAELLAVAAPA